MYVIRDMGHDRMGVPSPCWVWKGAMRNGRRSFVPG